MAIWEDKFFMATTTTAHEMGIGFESSTIKRKTYEDSENLMLGCI